MHVGWAHNDGRDGSELIQISTQLVTMQQRNDYTIDRAISDHF